jgi:phthiocerol/phenolphthiocerol synthesis type-I polyketide synthase E
MTSNKTDGVEPIAIIGMACRVPGANTVDRFWRNLLAGVESIRVGTLAEQAALGVPPDLLDDPDFVSVSSVLADPESFDAGVFGMSVAEAELRDPQHRLFLELAYTALEDSGHDPRRCDGDIGVFAGSGEDAYQWRNVRRNHAATARAGVVGLAVSSHPDYVATLTSYLLGLHGPSLTVHTACSTSLVAVHLACEALRNGECDMALAGAANLELPLGEGYLYMEGGVNSRDGHCRVFDASATGTVWASGGAVVVLRPLADAIAAGDDVRAVIIGNAVNNDGDTKAGFTAPSQQGQAAVITQALSVAGVNPRTIGFVEAHGTGTVLGDPIEVAALTSAYRRHSADRGWCAIGSVKANIGHLGSAAGVVGLLKAALTMQHGVIPPSLNYETANPEIDFGDNPFFVNTTPSVWDVDEGAPRRAAISSFGMGGTNAHIILEQAPPRTVAPTARPGWHLIQLSAKTGTALAATAVALANHLETTARERGDDLADVAYTLRVGRQEMPERLAVVAADLADAAGGLRDTKRHITGSVGRDVPGVVFMFPGQGAQYPGMGVDLYSAEPVYREAIDTCCTLLRDNGAVGAADLEKLLTRADGRDEALHQTVLAQPALFTVEYALAELWRSCGLTPQTMIGHSIGEYVAATCAGVFELSDALRLVATRGNLMQGLPSGAMIAVQMDEDELLSMLPEGASVAAVNGPGACVVSGPLSAIEELARTLGEAEVAVRRLRTTRAFHSAMMDPILSAFREVVARVQLRAPRIPFASNVTGDWITAADAADPSYWVRQLRDGVRFGDCVQTVAGSGSVLFLECGPGRQLTGLVRMQRRGHVAVPCLPGPGEPGDGQRTLAVAMGKLWAAGCELPAAVIGVKGNRVPLPTYPWERQRCWILPDRDVPGSDEAAAGQQGATGARHERLAIPAWRQLAPCRRRRPVSTALVLADDGDLVSDELAAQGTDVICVRRGSRFEPNGSGYRVRPASRDDYTALFADLAKRDFVPDLIVHSWTMRDGPAGTAEAVWLAQRDGFFSVLSLVQALAQTVPDSDVWLYVITGGSCEVVGGDLVRPEHATVAGAVNVLPQEFPWLNVRHIDVDPDFMAQARLTGRRTLVADLLDEICAPQADLPAADEPLVALRNGRRWRRRFTELAEPELADDRPTLRDRGAYLITGGLGGIGISIAEDLATRFQATLVLASRAGLPPRQHWDDPDAASISARARRAIDSIRRMEGAGARVHVIQADVAHPAAARALRDEAVTRCGQLHGIIHAAGVPGGGMAEIKDQAVAQGVLAPKIAGTLALRDAFAGDALDFVVLCSSVAAIAGGFGQVDYCAANAFLDAHAASDHGWNARVVSVNWGAWSKVGMAAEVAVPAEFRALQRGQRSIPIRHGLLTELHLTQGTEAAWCSGIVSPTTHWLLAEHRVAGIPVLPGTAYLEVVRCAFEACCPPPGPGLKVVRFSDLIITQPLAVPDGTSAELRVSVTPAADGTEFEVLSVVDGVTRVNARGMAAWVPAPAEHIADLSAIRERCSLGVVSGERLAASGSGLVTVGAHWRNLVSVHQGQGEELALLKAKEDLGPDPYPWTIQPAMMDQAVMAAWSGTRDGYLPFGYGSVVVLRELPATVWSHLRYRDQGTGEMVTVDLTLYDEVGRELLSVEDFAVRKVDRAAVTDAVTSVSSARLSSVNETGTISPSSGVSAFRRLLQAGIEPQVAVSARPLAELVADGRRLDYHAVAEGLAPPALAQAVRAPSGNDTAAGSEREKAVAEIFGELLGLPAVGLNEDFFEIGGNSLVAVQLTTFLRKRFGVRLPMRRFFADPTVAGVAALVDGLSQASDPAGTEKR